jgi:hypothetical protein
MSAEDISPDTKPFNRYLEAQCPAHLRGSAMLAYDCVAAAKRILLQEKVRDFTAADVVALAVLIERAGRA